jgi:hypothetical protein
VPTHVHLFGLRKDGLCGDILLVVMMTMMMVSLWPSRRLTVTFMRGVQALLQQSKKCVESGEEYVEKFM